MYVHLFRFVLPRSKNFTVEGQSYLLDNVFLGVDFKYEAVNSSFKFFRKSKYQELPGNSTNVGVFIGYKVLENGFVKSGLGFSNTILNLNQVITGTYSEINGNIDSDGNVVNQYKFDIESSFGRISQIFDVVYTKI